MGNLMIPCCVVCGASPQRWHDTNWEETGGLQDFCPQHAVLAEKTYNDRFVEYLAPHFRRVDEI